MNNSKTFIDQQYHRFFRHRLLQKHKQLVLYFIFGVTSALVDLSVYLVLFNIGHINAVLSTIISISLATIVGFFLNASYNFKVEDRYLLRFISYSSVSGVGMLVSSAMLYILHIVQGFDGNIVKVISLPIIFLVQYSLNTMISFRKVRSTGK